MSKKLRLLSFVMTILILVVSLPMYAFASGMDSEAEEITVDNTTYVLKELTDRREANVKYYLLSDRTSRAVVYPYDVHYLDENGEWQDIDNTLTLSQGNYEAKGKTEVKFAKKSGSTGLVSIKDGGYKIDFTPISALKSTAEITNSEKTDSRKYDDVKLLSGIKSEVLYENIYENTDIQYILKGLSLKENIIVKNARDSYSYEFELKLNGLKAELDEGKIVLSDYDTSEVKYIIPAPYMRDANGNYSNKVEYSLINESKWKYTLKITADAEWINSEETVFPVTIDPTLTTTNSGMIASQEDIGAGILFIGANQMVGGISEVYCPVTMPSIPSNAVLTNVKLIVYADSASSNSVKVGAYAITSSWNSSTISNGEPSVSTAVTDYIHAVGDLPAWDITDLAKSWLNGTSNYGVCLKEMTGSSYAHVAVNQSATILEVSYIDTVGIEEYFSYYTSSVSGGGTGYVNSYTGKLTFAHSIFSTADEIMPYSLSYVYTAPGSWKLSSAETLTQTTLADGQTCFVWVDGDGSSHYFTKIRRRLSSGSYLYYEYNDTGDLVLNNSTTKYYDNEGLGLMLKSSGVTGEYVISDDTGNKKYFSNGKITRIEDSVGNKRTFSYNSSNIVSISFDPNGTTPSFEQITITYDSNGRPSLIENIQTGVEVSFTYSGANLTYATYSYEPGYTETVAFEYESNKLIYVKNNTTGKGVKYSYSGNQVVKITEIAHNGSSWITGNYADITYYTGYTEYRTSGSDKNSTADDLTTTYKFDYKGRVITAYTKDQQGQVYGSSNYVYNDMNTSTDASVKTNNTLSSVTQSSYNSVNLLNNPDFEYSSSSATYWTTDSTCSIVTLESDKIANKNQLRIQRGAAGTSTLKQSVYLNPGTYTFSISVKLGEIEATGLVTLKAYSSSNTELASRKIDKDSSLNHTAWHKDSITFTVTTAGTYYVEVSYKTIKAAPTTLYLDEAMLEKSTGMGTFSCYPNGSFENTDSLSGTNKYSSTTQPFDGNKSMRLSSSISSQAYCQFNFYPETDGDTPLQSKIVSAWAYAPYSVQSANTANSPATFAIYVKSYYQGGQTETQIIPFNPQYDGWQYACGIVPMSHYSSGTSPNPITNIEVTLRYDYNIGYAYFDCVSMQRASEHTSYSYNSMGYVESKENSDGNKTSYQYASNKVDVVGVTDELGRTSGATYNSNHQITSSSNSGSDGYHNFSTDITYEDNGLVKSTLTSATIDNTVKKILTSATYNTDTTKAYYSKPATTTDERGNITTYYYNSKGLLEGTSLNGTVATKYVYNEYGMLIYVKEAVVSGSTLVDKSNGSVVQYGYNSKLELSSISSSTTLYQIYYDTFGKIDIMKVGNSTLADYTYAANNGNLTRLDYGNGAYVTYTYDKLDRVVGECYNGVQRATYTYAPNGNVSMVTDHTNGTNYLYYYSSDGEVSSVRVSDTNGILKHIFRYEYDEFGRIASKQYYFSSPMKTTGVVLSQVKYFYDADGNILRIENAGENEYYSYDELGRLTSNSFGSYMTDSYIYTDGEGYNYTTGLVNGVTTTIGSSTSSVYYIYDERGNIVQETRSPGGAIYYTYDDLDQLIREDNNVTGKTYIYTYDNGGNITSKKVYNYSRAATPSSLNASYSYGYGNSSWKDQLTSYNGYSISYDNIGNPLSYYNGSSYTFTWQNGRELATAVKGSNSISYKYNTDGIRVSKTVNGVLHEYTLEGTKIVREVIFMSGSTTSIDEDLRYFYDANGYLSSIVRSDFNGNNFGIQIKYFAKTNIQGDVLALYTYSGSTATLVASYTYDAWGNVISATASNSSDIVNLNPFRYRSYYYDEEIGLYYLNTRYYDAKLHRFLNIDNIAVIGATPEGLTDKNLYAYCDNNPVMRSDDGGQFWDTLFDVVSLASSVIEVVANPYDPWAWAGLAGDVIDLVPFVSGVGEVTRAVKVTKNVAEVADDIHDTTKAVDNTIDTYKALKKANKGTGKEIHHIVEKRFADAIDIDNTDEMLSIALDRKTHRNFTNAWRNELGYGKKYKPDEIWNAAQKVYKEYPNLLEAARKTIWR